MRNAANIATVSVAGDLDVTSAPAFKRTLDALIDGGCRRVVVNMSKTSYADSAGLGALLVELRRMRGKGGLMSLVNVSPRVYRTLALLRVVDMMPVSRAGVRRVVRELDPSVLPNWRTTFRVSPEQMELARERFSELCCDLPLSSDETFDLTLATGEAIGNAVDHTCAAGVLVTVAAYADRVIVDVTDCGEGFSLAADEDVPEAGADAERGRGIKLMRLLADSVSISPKTSGKGTVVHLVKLFPDSVAPR